MKQPILLFLLFFLIPSCNERPPGNIDNSEANKDSLAGAPSYRNDREVIYNDHSDSVASVDNSLSKAAITKNKFDIKIKLRILEGDSTGGLILITKNGVPFKRIESEGMPYPVALDFNENYLIKCSKKDYTTKIIFFDTHIPQGRDKEEFAKFFVEVELHKKIKGQKINSSKPVGGVKYDPKSEDFEAVH